MSNKYVKHLKRSSKWHLIPLVFQAKDKAVFYTVIQIDSHEWFIHTAEGNDI